MNEKMVEVLWNEMVKANDEKFKLKEELIIKEGELDRYKAKLTIAENNLEEAKRNYEFLKTINLHLKEDIAEYKRRLDACGYQE